MMKTVLQHPFRATTLLLVAVIVGALTGYGLSIEGAQAATRYTARLSFLIFALVFSISAWHHFWRNELSATLLANRRRLGLTFAYAHFVHLACVGIYVGLSGARPQPLRLAGGVMAYLLLTATVATSNDTAVRKLGHRRWKQLHTVGLYYLWFVFFMTYFPRLQGKLPGVGGGFVDFVVFFSVLLAIMGLRLTATFYHKTATS